MSHFSRSSLISVVTSFCSVSLSAQVTSSPQDSAAARQQLIIASSTPNDEIPFAPFALPSRFTIGWPSGAMHEGDMMVPIHLWSRTRQIEESGSKPPTFALRDCLRLTGLVRGFGIGPTDVLSSGCTAAFIPHFVIRQLSGGSAPVRTPSFNPGFEANLYVLGLDEHRGPDRHLLDNTSRDLLSLFPFLKPRADDRTGTLAAGHLRLAHYSNGQSGCLYTNQDYNEEDDTCTTRAGEPERLNTVDGSFSTHYIEAGMTVAPVAFSRTGHERQMAAMSFGVRSYPGGWVAQIGGMSEELARNYGRWEFSGGALARWRTPADEGGPFRTTRTLRFDGVCAYRRAASYSRCRSSIEGMISLPEAYGFGIAARYVYGWDYYNAGFGTPLRNPKRGWPVIALVFDHSRAVTITPEAKRQEAR